MIARRGALREQPETAKLRNGSRSAAARRNGTGPAPEGFAEKFNVRMLNFTSIMLPFDPRSADSGERSEGSDGATAPHGVEDMVCGQFRRAILERRAARALLREQPPSLCPTTVAHLARETLLRLGAPARDSVAAAAPFARALPVASVVRAVTDPRVAYTTSESTGLHRLHRLCNPVDSSALPVARAFVGQDARSVSVESRPQTPIPEAIPACHENTNPRPLGRRADSHESPAFAPFARVDPSPGLAATLPESGRSSEARDRARPANVTTARRPDRGDGTAARDARVSRRAVLRSRDEHDRSPTPGTKRGVSLSERSASANGRKRAKSASEPGTGSVFVPGDSLRSNSFRSEPSEPSALAEDAGRTPSQLRVPVCNLRGASFDRSRWLLDEGARVRPEDALLCVPDALRTSRDFLHFISSQGVGAQNTSDGKASRGPVWADVRLSRDARDAREEATDAFGERGKMSVDDAFPAGGSWEDRSSPERRLRSGVCGVGDIGENTASAEPAGSRAFAVADPDPDDWLFAKDFA